MFCPCLYHAFFFLFLCCVGAVVTNRTIDDTLGDVITDSRPVYLPTTVGVWEDATCQTCGIQPDKNEAFKGTWTAATYRPALQSISIELSFKGTAIYVFFILANASGNKTTSKGETACNFTLDGSQAGSFHHIPSASPDLEYNALVYSTNNLSNIDHKFIISTSGLDHNIFVNFDYAIYTFDDTPTTSKGNTTGPTPSSKTPVGAIVGGVIGGIAAISALILALLFCRRRKHKPTIAPFTAVNPTVSTSHVGSYTHSDFPPSRTITPFRSPVDAERNPNFYGDPSHSDLSNTSPSYPYHTMINHNFIATSSAGEIMISAHDEQNSSRFPLSPVSHPENNTEVVRRARQLELDRQVRVIEGEMRDLTRGIDTETAHQPSIRSQSAEIARMREQMRVMGEQIEFLRAQRQSEWAQGLSGALPPGYSPREQ